MNKRHYEHTLPNIRGSLSNTYVLFFYIYTQIGFSGRSLLAGLFVASPHYPPGFSLLSLTLYAPAMPEERYDDFFLN